MFLGPFQQSDINSSCNKFSYMRHLMMYLFKWIFNQYYDESILETVVTKLHNGFELMCIKLTNMRDIKFICYMLLLLFSIDNYTVRNSRRQLLFPIFFTWSELHCYNVWQIVTDYNTFVKLWINKRKLFGICLLKFKI